MTSTSFHLVFQELKRHGILLSSDPKLPSVTSLVTGEPVKGSWWGHPRAHAIYQMGERLADHPDVTVTKLVSEKLTYLYRVLWPSLLGVGTALEPWQLEALSTTSALLLEAVTKEGRIRTDRLPLSLGMDRRSAGEAALQLEKRLLVHSEQVHTEKGAHAKQLEDWDSWASRVGFLEERTSPEEGRRQLEDLMIRLNERFEAKGHLPWQIGP